MSNVQEEIRKLHFQLKQKDSIIEQLKQVIKKSNPDEEGEDAEVALILNQTVDIEQDGQKNQEQQLIEMLISSDRIDEKAMASISFSTLMNPKDLKAIMQNHNKFLEDAQKL